MSRYSPKLNAWCADCLKNTHNTADCWGQGTVAMTADEKMKQMAAPHIRGGIPALIGEHCTIPRSAIL